MELVNAACNFEPHESFFSLFSDPRSTRLTRIHLREDLVQDQDLEAIRKQVRPASPASGDSHGEAGRRGQVSRGPGARLQHKNPARPRLARVWSGVWPRGRRRWGWVGCGDNRAVPATRTWWSCT